MHCNIILNSHQGLGYKLFRLACILPIIQGEYDTYSVEMLYDGKNLWPFLFDIFIESQKGVVFYECDCRGSNFSSDCFRMILQNVRSDCSEYLSELLTKKKDLKFYNYYFRGTDRVKNLEKRQKIKTELLKAFSLEKPSFFFTDDQEMWDFVQSQNLPFLVPLRRIRSAGKTPLHKNKNIDYLHSSREFLEDLQLMLLSKRICLCNWQKCIVNKILTRLIPNRVCYLI